MFNFTTLQVKIQPYCGRQSDGSDELADLQISADACMHDPGGGQEDLNFEIPLPDASFVDLSILPFRWARILATQPGYNTQHSR
jgi:hypothetical protein